MIHKQKIFNILFLWTTLFILQMHTGCSSKPEYIIFKTGERDQLQERAIKYCYGDFKVLEEEEIGPYTHAHLECKE
jgi:hypothetical protein